jgi:glycosyltransferase involved in cell wall biosynthesis
MTLRVNYLVSSYNKRDYLPAVLRSVERDQALTGGHVILIDDGSQDGSDAICEDFARQNHAVSYFRQENRGIFGTTNRLVGHSNADWVRFVDCDDPILPGSTAYLIDLAEREGTDLAFGEGATYGPDPLALDACEPFSSVGAGESVIDDALAYSLRNFSFVPTQCVLRRATLSDIFPLREDLVSCQDYAINLRVARRSGFARTNAVVCRRLVGASNRLSYHEALTFHQTARIVKDVACEGFDEPTQRQAVAKQIGRAMRWMRHNRPHARLSLRYWSFFWRRQSCRVLGKVPFHRWMDAIIDLYAEDAKDILRGKRPY